MFRVHCARSGRLSDERGQVTVLLGILGLAMVIGAAVVLVALGQLANDRARARSAADAAALAGARSGERSAGDIARRNGGLLESFAVVDGQTEVTVRVGRARATSRAEITWDARARSPANRTADAPEPQKLGPRPRTTSGGARVESTEVLPRPPTSNEPGAFLARCGHPVHFS